MGAGHWRPSPALSYSSSLHTEPVPLLHVWAHGSRSGQTVCGLEEMKESSRNNGAILKADTTKAGLENSEARGGWTGKRARGPRRLCEADSTHPI